MIDRKLPAWLCVIVSCATLTLSSGAAAQAPCDRACLKGFADGYVAALARRDPSSLPVADDFRYTENGRVIALGEGFWHTAGTQVRYRDYVLDPESGGVVVLTAVSEYDAIAQVMLRLKVVDREITEIETFVVRIGDQRWFAPENLDQLSDLYARTVPPGERHTREELIRIANSYFTAVQTEGTPEFVQAPFGAGMKRIENGLQTTHVTENPVVDRHTMSPAEQLERAFYAGTIVADRRFPVVDVEHGSVAGIVAFRREGDDTSTLLLCEIFKITEGELKEIRAVMLNLPRGASTGWR